MAAYLKLQRDSSRKTTSLEGLEEGQQEQSRSRCKCTLRGIYDSFSYPIEYIRSWMFNPIISFTQRVLHFGGDVFNPKSKVEESLLEFFPSERKDVKHSLLMSRLSLYDSFGAEGGVPGYRLSKPFTSAKNGASSESWVQQQKDEKSACSSSKLVSALEGTSQEDGSVISVCAFSENGARFVICYASGEVVVWDTDHGDTVAETKGLSGTHILAASFALSSESSIQIATQDCKCWRWDSLKDSFQMEDISAYWRDIERAYDQIELNTADFFDNGSIFVCSSIRDADCAHKIEFVVAESTHVSMLEDFVKLEVEMYHGSIVSGVEISPDGKGLLVGTSDNSMKTGVCYLWPSFKEKTTGCQTLAKGTLGSWSSKSDLVVTWTVPDGPNPEENDGSSAFLWNINEMRNNIDNARFTYNPIVLQSPFGENVLWCRLVLDLKGKDRLIMALIGKTTRFLFWDVDSETHTHTIETTIQTKRMPLTSTKTWRKSLVEKKSVKGLSPMAVMTDRSKFGAVLGKPGQVLIYDAMLGIQSLKLTPQQSEASEFVGGADIMFSPTNGKIAMVGQHNAMVFAPSTPSPNSQSNGDIVETPMIELKNRHAGSIAGAEYKLLFSGDGNTLGLLTIGHCEMQVYHLAKGTTCAIKMDPQMQAGIVDFCFSLDGQYLVTSTSSMAIYLWECANEKGVLKGKVRDTVETIAIGITPDTKQIIVCSEEGDVYWYTSSTNDESGNGKSLRNVRTCISPGIHDSIGMTRPQQDLEADERAPLLSKDHRLRHAATIGSIRGMDRTEPTFIYKCTDRIPRSAVLGCRISANCERAAIVRTQGHLEVWNLKDKTKERTMPFNVSTTINQQSIPLSGVAIPFEGTGSELQSCESLDKWKLDQERTVFPENEDFILTNSTDKSLASLLQQNHSDFSTPFEENLNEDLSSIYIVNHKAHEHSRQLNGRNLRPKKGLAISADGRHVACLVGKFASKIVVWSAYASQDLLPDYHSLSLVYDIKSKAVVEQETQRLLQLFGSNFFNFQHPSGLTVLLDAVNYLNKTLLCSILDYGLEHDVKVSFLISEKTNDQSVLAGYANAVEASLMRRSPKIVKVIMPALLKRVTHEAELSSILTRSIIHLHNKYPEIFQSAIEGSDLFNEVCKIEVSENLFDREELLPITAPCLSLSDCKMKQTWESDVNRFNKHKMKEAGCSESGRANEPEQKEAIDSEVEGAADCTMKTDCDSKLEKASESDSVTLTASALSFPFDNACQFGRHGLLRYLLLDGAHHSVFGSFAIRAIVDFKWRTYAKMQLLQELIHHCLIAVAFTVYCFFLHQEETFEIASTTGDEENSISLQCSLIVCWILAFPCLVREIIQCTVYSVRHQWAGFVYWLRSGWNWMEVLSYFNIVVVIPLGHFVFANKGHWTIGLSVMAATESLLLWSRMLFYARPFSPTGPFVIVIASLASTIMPFLLLAFCVMFGFAVAFHILYRHVRKIDLDDLDDDSPFVSMHGSFHTLENTLFTTFGFLFGQFEVGDLYFAPSEPAAMLLFALYMVIMSLILLNMLIALMGERFEKIQKSKETRFTEARAKAVDDVDSMLSKKRKDSLKYIEKSFLE